jgi:hypothetical protein
MRPGYCQRTSSKKEFASNSNKSGSLYLKSTGFYTRRTGLRIRIRSNMDQISIKTPNPECRLYWCLMKLIDWRYSQSCWYFRPLFWTSAPLTFSRFDLPLPCMSKHRGMYLHSVYQRGGGLRQNKHLPPNPYTGKFWRKDDLQGLYLYSYLVHVIKLGLCFHQGSYSSLTLQIRWGSSLTPGLRNLTPGWSSGRNLAGILRLLHSNKSLYNYQEKQEFIVIIYS